MTRILYDLTGANDVRFSPNCWRSRMALAHKGLDAHCEPVRFTDKDKIAFSEQIRVPVLKDGDTVVCDSWSIACYLEDTYPDRPSLFGGPEGRGAMHFISCWTDATLHPAMVRTILFDIHENLEAVDKDYFRESREKRFGKTLEEVAAAQEPNLVAFRQALAPLNALLGEQGFVCGDAPAYGDYLIFGVFQWARAVSPARLLEPDEPLHAWRERMLNLFDGLGRMVKARES
jgi:glutathione S-transferase